MKDDITRVQISKVDIATGKELPGAELVIKDKDGNTVAQWVSKDKPHYIEKLPSGDYTLTEITAPNGYQLAESIAFTVLPTGELQTVVMKDARIPEENAAADAGQHARAYPCTGKHAHDNVCAYAGHSPNGRCIPVCAAFGSGIWVYRRFRNFCIQAPQIQNG